MHQGKDTILADIHGDIIFRENVVKKLALEIALNHLCNLGQVQ